MSISIATLGMFNNVASAKPVCDPELESIEFGALSVDVDDLDVEEIEPGPAQELLPNRIEVTEVLPTLNIFSLPTNL